MLEKGNEIIIKAGNILIDKLKDLKDPAEISKCIRFTIGIFAFGHITNIICKNGGINYKNILLIGTTKNNI